MNENTTINKKKSYELLWFASELQFDQSQRSTPTLEDIEAVVNKALKACVNEGHTPISIQLTQPMDYIRVVVITVDDSAPQAVKQAFQKGC
jgi:hypothetical protein